MVEVPLVASVSGIVHAWLIGFTGTPKDQRAMLLVTPVLFQVKMLFNVIYVIYF